MHFKSDFGSIGDIIAKVRDADLIIPAGFDVNDDYDLTAVRERRAELGSSIAHACIWYDAHSDLTSSARAKARYERLDKVGALAKRLVDLIEDEGNPLVLSLSRHLSTDSSDASLYQLLSALRKLPQAAFKERVRLAADGMHIAAPFSPSPGSNAPPMTAGDRFILSLAETFREFFDAEPRILQDEDREPYGPFIAFVMAVRRDAGDPATADAVRKAWDRSQDKDSETE